ncbi:MAG: hypothetical protein CVV49_05200 [Spirochaetae bacterium HGW-Spirochaetae-5]|nr:MAG: hypothetical protein CVV49_05200 [Spirochaetae bacterium HGW-Spirochaetae-5]
MSDKYCRFCIYSKTVGEMSSPVLSANRYPHLFMQSLESCKAPSGGLTCTHILLWRHKSFLNSPLNPPEGDLKDVDNKKIIINTQNFEDFFLKSPFWGFRGLWVWTS